MAEAQDDFREQYERHLFHEDVPFEFVDRVFAVMADTPRHTFQILTKRPARMLEYLSQAETRSLIITGWLKGNHGKCLAKEGFHFPLPLKNVWLGVSVEDQATADERIPLLLRTPAAVRWVSAEPLLGAVDMKFLWQRQTTRSALGQTNRYAKVNWIVVGGESCNKARPMHPEWARSIREQCKGAGVPFLFKQTGAWQMLAPGEHGKEDHGGKPTQFFEGATFVKTRGGGSQELDGKLWQEWPSR